MNTFNPTKLFPVEWVYITPGMATDWLSRNEGNRNKRQRHIERLVRDLQSGNFLPTGDSIKFDWNGRLIDGQHRLSSIIASGTGMWAIVVRQLDPRVRSVLDTNAKRSGSDALYFEGVEGWRIVIAAMARIDMSRESGRLQKADDTSSAMPTNIEIVEWAKANPDCEYAAGLSGKLNKDLGIPPSVLAYAILTLSRIDPMACVEFFTSAAEHRTDGVGDPRLTMTRTFDSHSGPSKSTISNAASLSIIYRAWNAWRDGRTLRSLPLASRGEGVQIPQPK